MRIPLRLGETLLGRSPYCSIVLNDPLVSRQHAALHMTSEGLSIEDLDSRNGTRVNGELVRAKRGLVAGDTIELGRQTLNVEVSSRADGPATRTLSRTGDFAPFALEAPTHARDKPGAGRAEGDEEPTLERAAPELPAFPSA
ncbi:MAG TPA: FHA domain-containing protein [Polyangiaceae bacterium]|nr:FHA domain-containing protein [Polyangiaceae bacterium]